jgi:hypothetical protein
VIGPLASVLLGWLAPAARCADIDLTPAADLQIVAWVETSAGQYVDTLYITQETGRFGLGNRPGRFDFNSGPMFPYGRRTPTFPVWAHRHGMTFPMVLFQNSPDDPAVCESYVNDPNGAPGHTRDYADCGENNLSHSFSASSRELHYCQPLMPSDPKWSVAEAMTCATIAYTDKGRLSTTVQSVYPPRADLVQQAGDLTSVQMYRLLNPFDAISQATPVGGMHTQIAWPVPAVLADGDYVLYVEVSKAFDHNATYSTTTFPPPEGTGPKGITWSQYGLPYRGQPSIVYRVPFSIGPAVTTAWTDVYDGYGAPDGDSGVLNPPDATITTDTPGSGAARLQLVSDGGVMYRARIRVRPNTAFSVPGAPEDLTPTGIATDHASLAFIAPDVSGGRVAGYDVRLLANEPITDDNFEGAMPITTTVPPADPGTLQSFDVMGLLPETEYYVGIRAYDACRNAGELAVVKITTADRVSGQVDACFVATAAYGTMMANDVELLRHVRDALLETSVLGELAVETYYTFGPAVAGLVGESDVLRRTARAALAPVIRWVKPMSY